LAGHPRGDEHVLLRRSLWALASSRLLSSSDPHLAFELAYPPLRHKLGSYLTCRLGASSFGCVPGRGSHQPKWIKDDPRT
jgi:hypothetical protein